MALGQSKLVGYTDSSGEEEDLHVDVNFNEPIDLAIKGEQENFKNWNNISIG